MLSMLYNCLFAFCFEIIHVPDEELNTKKPTPVSFWFPRNLSNHMDRQARTRDTVLVKSREMAG